MYCIYWAPSTSVIYFSYIQKKTDIFTIYYTIQLPPKIDKRHYRTVRKKQLWTLKKKNYSKKIQAGIFLHLWSFTIHKYPFPFWNSVTWLKETTLAGQMYGPTFFLSSLSCSSFWKCFSLSRRCFSASSRALASASSFWNTHKQKSNHNFNGSRRGKKHQPK